MKILSTELQIQQAQREARQWRRIANRLYDVLTDPDTSAHQRHDTIEMYRNYAFEDDDE